ncbi:MAG: hypothetical protein EZS28_008597 [Streblomastix strix]|uniref:Uncharacterized protein n=1 Tax=Streblomastix strix TaxID=222440 RepID=A0A5J4WML7_9EUKA|nr:MAG: hypothetical protein EZS28_008597 [Streblomastix strix]
MSTGSFYEFPVKEIKLKELGEGQPDDFQCFPMSVNAVVPIPYYSFSHHHSIDDRFVLRVGNGRSGALHYVGLGRIIKSHQVQFFQYQHFAYPSPIKTLTSYQIFNRSFLVVGYEQP